MEQPIKLTKIQTENWMAILLSRAKGIGLSGEVPVTALVLDQNGKCIGHGSNIREQQKDPLGHAEIVALRQAALIKNDWRFNECTMLVTLEPCPMCAGALIQARMGQVIFGAPDLERRAWRLDKSCQPSKCSPSNDCSWRRHGQRG